MPSHKHRFPLCLRYCFSSCDMSSPIFTVSSFLFSIHVTTCLIVASTFWAWIQPASVIFTRETQNHGTDGLLMTGINFHQGIRTFHGGLEDGLNCFCPNTLIPWEPRQCIHFHVRFFQSVIKCKVEFSKLDNPPMSHGVQLSTHRDIGQRIFIGV